MRLGIHLRLLLDNSMLLQGTLQNMMRGDLTKGQHARLRGEMTIRCYDCEARAMRSTRSTGYQAMHELFLVRLLHNWHRRDETQEEIEPSAPPKKESQSQKSEDCARNDKSLGEPAVEETGSGDLLRPLWRPDVGYWIRPYAMGLKELRHLDVGYTRQRTRI